MNTFLIFLHTVPYPMNMDSPPRHVEASEYEGNLSVPASSHPPPCLQTRAKYQMIITKFEMKDAQMQYHSTSWRLFALREISTLFEAK